MHSCFVGVRRCAMPPFASTSLTPVLQPLLPRLGRFSPSLLLSASILSLFPVAVAPLVVDVVVVVVSFRTVPHSFTPSRYSPPRMHICFSPGALSSSFLSLAAAPRRPSLKATPARRTACGCVAARTCQSFSMNRYALVPFVRR